MPRRQPRLHPVRFAVWVLVGLMAFGALTAMIILLGFPNYDLLEAVQLGIGD